MKRKHILCLFLALFLLLLTACGDITNALLDDVLATADTPTAAGVPAEAAETYAPPDESRSAADAPVPAGSPAEAAETGLPVYGEFYYDVANVVLYLEQYGELPPNYITKKEAQDLGWEGGSVEAYRAGAAIGGDTFGNREGLLPKADGRRYTECDIDTNGTSSRGSRRLVFSNDGLYFYTADHYESFAEVTVTAENEVIW